MSRRSGRRHLRSVHADQLPEHDSAVAPGCCLDTPDEIANMRQLTHDQVIAMTGHLRTSGVRWLQWNGEAARKVLREVLAAGRDPDDIAAYDTFLATYGEQAAMVVAVVDVLPGSAAAHGAP